MVVVDAGGALLANPHVPGPTPAGHLNRADVMIRAQALMGMEAMGIGPAEAAVGPRWLGRAARQSSLTLLSANLKVQGGASPFLPHKIVQAGEVKIGLFSIIELTPARLARPMLRRARLRISDPVRAARAQVKALAQAGAEVIVMMAHVGMPRAKKIVGAVPGIHLAIVAGSGTTTSVPVKIDRTFLVEAGGRGRNLGHAQLRLGEGWTPDQELVDDSVRHELYREAALARRRIQEGAGKKGVRTPRGDTMKHRLERMKSLVGRLEGLPAPRGPHTLVASLIVLDAKVKDHPAVKRMLDTSRSTWTVPPPPRAAARRPTDRPRARRIPGRPRR